MSETIHFYSETCSFLYVYRHSQPLRTNVTLTFKVKDQGHTANTLNSAYLAQ